MSREPTYEDFKKIYDKMSKAGKLPQLSLKELAKNVYMELKVRLIHDTSPTFPIDFDVKEKEFRKEVEEFSREIKKLAEKDGLKAIVLCHRDLPKEMQEWVTEKTRGELYKERNVLVAEGIATAKDVKAGLKNRVYVFLKKGDKGHE